MILPGVLGAVSQSAGASAFVAFGGLVSQYTHSGTTYRVHTFRGSGNFVVTSGSPDTDATYLIVGGGAGGGAGNPGAGGGAGGMRTGTTTLTGGTTYPIVVGWGGSSAWYTYGPYGIGDDARKGEDGVDSVAFSVTADGGGGGAGMAGDNTGRDGGSGGGGSASNNTGAATGSGGSGTEGQGNDGGDAVLIAHSGYEYTCAGGGGGGAVGGDSHGTTGGSANTGADGGAGASGIGITSATRIYAGGGAGSDYPYSVQTVGGSGIGGRGTQTTNGPGFAAVPNTGSGAGGGHHSAQADGKAASGSMGIVIIRYEVAA